MSSIAKLIETSTLKAPMHEQRRCVFFQLPPELRNRIYEMAFESKEGPVDLVAFFPPKVTADDQAQDRTLDHNTRSPDLIANAPPSSALLHACQQIHLESKGIFGTALQSYLAKEFIVDVRDRKVDASAMTAIPDGLLGRIRKFTFLVILGPAKAKASWSWSKNRWHVGVTSELPFPTISFSE